MKPENHLLLVTVTRVESRAVLEAFEKHTGKPAEIRPRGEKTYHDLGAVNGTRVWLVLSEMGAGGLGGAQQTVTKAIAEIQPAAVVMVGIAFGMNEGKQAIGDILVSENLRLYELQRVGAKRGQPEIILRGDRPHGSPWLLDAFRNADLHWKGAKVRFGCVLTGEKLVDNKKFREQLRRFELEAIGGEMEGAGLYAACQDAKVDWLLVKAICDWADGHKETDRQTRQELAACNAAGFVVHALKTVSLQRSDQGQGSRDRGRGEITISQSGSGGLGVGRGNVVAGEGGIAIGGDFRLTGDGPASTRKRRTPKKEVTEIPGRKRAVQATRPKREQVFISYSHRDERWLEELKVHLAPYVRAGGCDVWCDKDIEPGAKWRASIESAMQRARVAVLLVSPYFLASEFIANHELSPLLAAARDEGTTILWIPVSTSSYDATEIKDYQAAIPPARPLDRMNGRASRNAAFVKICKLIMKAVGPAS